MSKNDNVIYATISIGGDPLNQHMVRVNEPKGITTNANFLVTWQDMDWSGFMTLEEAVEMIPGLVKRDNAELFKIVER